MIDSATLTYMPFTDRRKSQGSGFEAGQSGKLLVGTGASGKKYIIKHCHPHNAANEYVACWLAKRLGVPAPSAYLLSPNKAFQSKYAVAIEFLDLKPFDKHGGFHLLRRMHSCDAGAYEEILMADQRLTKQGRCLSKRSDMVSAFALLSSIYEKRLPPFQTIAVHNNQN